MKAVVVNPESTGVAIEEKVLLTMLSKFLTDLIQPKLLLSHVLE